MAVSLIISRVSGGDNIEDSLINDQVGINHGEVTNNVTTLEEIFYISHTGTELIENLKVYLDGLSELLDWADANAGDGLLIDADNDQNFESNIKTGVGDSLANAISLGDINPGAEKIIRVKIKIPTGESNPGVRNFPLKYNYDATI